MHRVSKILFVSAASIVLAGGVAAADRAPKRHDDDASADRRTATKHAGDDDSSPDSSSTPSEETAESAAAQPTKDSWPTAASERPLTAAQGMLEVTPMGTFSRASAGNTSVTGEGATIAARYGISSRLELAASYTGITLNPSSNWKGALAAGLGFSMIRGAAGGRLDIAPRAGAIYDLTGKTVVAVASADVRYKLSSRLWLGTPFNVPGLEATVKGADVMGTTASATPIVLQVPFAVGYQATSALQLQASTVVASISIKDSHTTTIADGTPLTIDALYALGNKLDLRVDLGLPDLQHAGDALSLAAGINLRL